MKTKKAESKRRKKPRRKPRPDFSQQVLSAVKRVIGERFNRVRQDFATNTPSVILSS